MIMFVIQFLAATAGLAAWFGAGSAGALVACGIINIILIAAGLFMSREPHLFLNILAAAVGAAVSHAAGYAAAVGIMAGICMMTIVLSLPVLLIFCAAVFSGGRDE